MSEREILLSMNAIEKKFGDVQVLKKVDMEVARGEVHALMGENGAGKSTLIKILTGVYPKDGGSITFSGKACEINSRSDAQKLGIGVIYQELSLIPTLSVMQNVLLGKEKSGWGFQLLRDVNTLLSTQSSFLLGKWIEDARSLGIDEAGKGRIPSNKVA